jgi:predicted transcriptional regulator
MAQSLIEMTKDLVLAFIKNDLLAPEDVQQELMKTHAILLELQAHEERDVSSMWSREGETASAVQPVDWRKSIQRYEVECLICGQTFKQLTVRHLSYHGLDLQTYRLQFGIPRTQTLSSKETTAKRRRITQTIRPWERAPNYRRSGNVS